MVPFDLTAYPFAPNHKASCVRATANAVICFWLVEQTFCPTCCALYRWCFISCLSSHLNTRGTFLLTNFRLQMSLARVNERVIIPPKSVSIAIKSRFGAQTASAAAFFARVSFIFLGVWIIDVLCECSQ